MNTPSSRSIEFAGIHCRIVIERHEPAIVVIRLSGWDVGELGAAPLLELAKDVAGEHTIELFVDARAVRGASIEVSAEWAHWLSKHRAHFRRIDMLAASPFIQLTANFVRRFAELGDVMRVCTDPAAFDEELRRVIHSDIAS